MTSGNGTRKRIAVIGGGISGLTAAYYLSKNEAFDVTLFESQDRVGGHAHTYNHNGVNMDTTVISFHEGAYPNFVKLIHELGVYGETQHFKQDLCFHTEKGVEFMMTYKPLGMLSKPLTIYKTAMTLKKLSRAVVNHSKDASIDALDFHEFLKSVSMSEYEINCLVLPLIHMFVGLPPADIRQMPARFLVDHLYHHKLLHHSSLTAWRGWKNGTVSYISKLEAAIQGRVYTGGRVQSIERIEGGKVRVHHENQPAEEFDRVVIATPPATALRLLKEPTQVEERLLSPWKYATLRMCIHKDQSVLPARELHRGFWNPYIDTKADSCAATYMINKLHPKLEKGVVVSWGPIQP
ncbi:MAG: FAD-dependent oxidoreductase, partial [Pseudobdellovibrionaceae bacterium]|nr:FAD-dependent oxidoreductase [Pseudobdellovibrionaceae bacterium]